MKKIGIIPDSFKGSMSSEVVASTIERVAKEVFSCETSAMPIADGGEGSTKVILAKTGGKLVSVKVLSPERKEIEAYFGVMTDGTCVIEIAESSGLAKQTSFEAMGISCDTVTGAGAAGGAGYGCVAFLNAEIVSGIEAMLDIYQFDENMQDADLIITGEGKLDEQSLMGKVLCGVKKHAGDIPILSVCGSCTLPKETLLANGVTALEIGRGLSTKESMERGEELLEKALREYFCAM